MILDNDDGVSVVIPVFNEKEAVSRLAARLEEVRSRAACPIEFILVNDGSDDGTGQLLREMALTGKRLLEHPRNRGYGASLKTGVRAARYAWIAITDADETYPDHRIPELCERARAGDLDMVVGARMGPGARLPLLRRPPKWFLTKLAGRLSRSSIPDLNSGLRVMRRSSLLPYLRILPDGFSFTATITLVMLSNGARVEYAPIEYRRRSGRSKVRPIYDTLNFVQLICRTVLWFNPLRVFLPLSLLLMVGAVGVLLTTWAIFGRPWDVTFGVLILTGVLVLAIGLLADLIDKRIGP
jgi:glycosyltransferase involved in cell wall biosynthesis